MVVVHFMLQDLLHRISFVERLFFCARDWQSATTRLSNSIGGLVQRLKRARQLRMLRWPVCPLQDVPEVA